MRISNEAISFAAAYLAARRLSGETSARLSPELRPNSTEDALHIQDQFITRMDRPVGGWKCLLPQDDRFIVAPIFNDTIHLNSDECQLQTERNICRIEPEIAFRLNRDFPKRDEPYTDEEIHAGLGSAHMALELIKQRSWEEKQLSFYESLADCLVNQGLYVGPEIDLAAAVMAKTIDFDITINGAQKSLPGVHPNNDPIAPLYWLINHLNERGHEPKKDQFIITGSFAGVIETPAKSTISIQYAELGKLELTLLGRSTR